MAKKKKAEELSDDEVNNLIDTYVNAIEDMREFFLTVEPEENEDDFYDLFLTKHFMIEKAVKNMIKAGLIVNDDGNLRQDDIVNIPLPKGVRSDN